MKETEKNPIVIREILCRLLTDHFPLSRFFVPCSMELSPGGKNLIRDTLISERAPPCNPENN